MTPKEALIQAIQTSPDNIVSSLLNVLNRLNQRPEETSQAGVSELETVHPEQISDRLREKNGFLVVETGDVTSLDIGAFIREMREERVQSQIDKMGLESDLNFV